MSIPPVAANKLFTQVLANKAYRKDNIILDGFSAVKCYVEYMNKIKCVQSSLYSASEVNYYDNYPIALKIHDRMIQKAKEVFQGNFKIYSRELVEAIRFIESQEFIK